MTGLSFIPGASVIGGAFKVGSSVLNPDPSLADLRRSENEIKKEVKESFISVTNNMKNVSSEIKFIREDVLQVMNIICDSKFNDGMEDVNAQFEYFLERADDLKKCCDTFHSVAAAVQIAYKKNFSVSKLFKFLKIIHNQEGPDTMVPGKNGPKWL